MPYARAKVNVNVVDPASPENGSKMNLLQDDRTLGLRAGEVKKSVTQLPAAPVGTLTLNFDSNAMEDLARGGLGAGAPVAVDRLAIVSG